MYLYASIEVTITLLQVRTCTQHSNPPPLTCTHLPAWCGIDVEHSQGSSLSHDTLHLLPWPPHREVTVKRRGVWLQWHQSVEKEERNEEDEREERERGTRRRERERERG